MSNFPTNLTEKQWQVIKNIVEPQERNRKKISHLLSEQERLPMANASF